MGRPRLFGRRQTGQAQQALAPIFNVAQGTDGGPAEVTLFGDVVQQLPRDWWTDEPIPGMYIAVDDVLDRLEEIRDAPEINIRLNTCGGDLFAGVTIHDMLRSFKGRKTITIEGIAASAGSLIACAGDTVRVHEGSMIMIHNVRSLLFGYYGTADLDKVLRSHEGTETSCKRIYGRRCRKSDAELQRMMDEETWMVGTDAIEAGFADELTEEPDEGDQGEGRPDTEERPRPGIDAHLSANGDYLVVAGVPHLAAELGSIPAWVTNRAEAARPPARNHEADNGDDVAPTSEEAAMINSAADLRSQYPELAAAIANEAVEDAVPKAVAKALDAERERLRKIDEVQDRISDRDLVNRAKYGEHPMSAEELAFEAMKDGSLVNSAFLAALDEDSEESDTEKVDPDPNDANPDEDEQQDPEKENRENERVFALYNQMTGREVQ